MSTINLTYNRGQAISYSTGLALVLLSGSTPAGFGYSPSTNTSFSGVANDLPGDYSSNWHDTVYNVFYIVVITIVDPTARAVPTISCSAATTSGGVNRLTVDAGQVVILFTAAARVSYWSNVIYYASGISLNMESGFVTGNGVPGVYVIGIQATNTSSDFTPNVSQVSLYVLALTVRLALPVVSLADSGWPYNLSRTVGDAIMLNPSAGAPSAPVTWAATGLPTGLALNSTTGMISGKCLTAATSNITLTATNSTGSGSLTFALVILPVQSVPVVTLDSVQPGWRGQQQYNASPGPLTFATGVPVEINFSGTNTPTSWAATDLPTGLSISAAAGKVTGRLITPGDYTFRVVATNAIGASDPLTVFVVATGLALAFQFVSEDPTLCDVQIDARTGAVSSSQPLAFKQFSAARLALVFLDQYVPVTPPAAADVMLGIRPKNRFDAGFLFPAPTLTSVAASGGQPAYLLAEFDVDGAELDAELNALLAQLAAAAAQPAAAPQFLSMADVIWKTAAGVKRASATFDIVLQPAVTE